MKTHLGHYEIVAELGRGGMGVVYKGYEPALSRHVAIKELSPSLAHDPNLVERFLREARSMAVLNDPHIIQIYFIGTDEATGQPFFAMEFVEGESLSGLLRREGRLSVENALKIMYQTAQGLATAHDKGVIHRDIKPGNLMITPRGQVKIADFGIALATQDFSKKLTSTGEFVGTPGYLSPEVCLGKVVDRRSDIFSLGIVLYEMLTGRIPFTDESPLGLMLEVVKAEIPDIRQLNSEVDPQTAQILTRMLAKEASDRFQSCHELAAALEEHPLVAKGGTLKLSIPKPAPAEATVVGAPTPGSQPRAATPPPVIGRAATAPSQRVQQPEPAPQPQAAPVPPQPAPAARPSVLEREKSASSKLPLAIAAALVLMLGGTAFAMRATIGEFVDGFMSGAPTAREAGQVVGAATNPISPAQAAATPAITPATNPAAPADTGATVASTAPAVDTSAAYVPPDASTATAPSTQPADSGAQAAFEQAPPLSANEPVEQKSGRPQYGATDDDGAMTGPVAANDSPRRGANLLRALNSRDSQANAARPREPAVVSAPARVAVITLGDPALTGPARQVIEARLMRDGFNVLDTSMVAGVDGSRDLPGVLNALRREATMVVVVRAEEVGAQQLNYYGQSSTVYTANLSVRTYLVADKRPLGGGYMERVDFATLNANDKAKETVTPMLDGIVSELKPYRGGTGRG